MLFLKSGTEILRYKKKKKKATRIEITTFLYTREWKKIASFFSEAANGDVL